MRKIALLIVLAATVAGTLAGFFDDTLVAGFFDGDVVLGKGPIWP